MDQNKINQLKEYSIVFAEDETGLRNEIKEVLETVFKKAYIAKNGLEAKELYLEYKPDILMTDIKMPHLSGIELAQYIRQNDDSTFIAIISAFTEVELILQSTELNLLKYIVKPITKTKLFEVFDKFLDKKLGQNIIYFQDGYIFYKDQAIIKHYEDIFKLTSKELKFLDLLFQKKAIVTYDEMEYILQSDFESQHHIRQFIKKLRTKLPQNFLTNVQGEGYILTSY